MAETLYDPFGEDDQDFELNELLNRHFKVCMTIVDENEIHPELKKDIFWNLTEPELTHQNPTTQPRDRIFWEPYRFLTYPESYLGNYLADIIHYNINFSNLGEIYVEIYFGV